MLKLAFFCTSIFVIHSPSGWIMKKQFLFILILNIEEYVFRNRGVSCNYRVREEEMKRHILGLMWSGGLLWSFAGSLCSFAGGLRSFVVVCGHLLVLCSGLRSLPVLVTMPSYNINIAK